MNNFGTLYVVATPIGNLGDFSPRAVEVLADVDLIAAEDTRHSQKLLAHYNIGTRMWAVHEHNEVVQIEVLLEKLKAGESIAIISDAGTPLISDPGFPLVQAAHQAEIKVVPVPGACAAIAALSAAGLPSDRFSFEGFLPAKQTARKKKLEAVKNETRTTIFYESPHRIVDSLTDMATVFGENRLAVVAREITKTFETIKRDSLENLLLWINADNNQQKGEFVVLVTGAKPNKSDLSPEACRILNILVQQLPKKQAAALTSEITGENKKMLYNQLLSGE